jgi:hypothetical protein
MTTKDIAFTRKVLRPAVGRINGVRRSISVGFDPADFERIAALAAENRCSFQEQARKLCKLALNSGHNQRPA